MPVMVATELLCEPKTRMTSRMRKNCLVARQTWRASELQKEPAEVKLATRLRKATWLQLHCWLKRVVNRRADVQRAFVRIAKLEDNPVTQRAKAALDLKAATLEIVRDGCEEEIARRQASYVKRPAR